MVTQDVGFAAILAATGDRSPSVIQVRRAESLDERLAAQVADVARRNESALNDGVVLSLDAATGRTRARLLWLEQESD